MTRSLIIVLTTLFLLTPAFAAEPGKSNGHLFWGIKGGFMKPSGSGNDSAGNIGAVMGQSFARYLSWEAELNLTVFDGEVGTRDWDINTLGGYAVFRSEGDINVKAKGGLVYWDDTFDNDIDLSLGIGVGFKMGKSGMLDVEFTQINSDVDYISVGYIFNY